MEVRILWHDVSRGRARATRDARDGALASALRWVSCAAVNRHKPDLHGKVAVVTGANSGIGKETAVELASLGAAVVMACRDRQRSEPSLEEVKQRSKSSRVSARQRAMHARRPSVRRLLRFWFLTCRST